MELEIEIPKKEDFKKVNELAKQVQEMHVQWRPDLFLSVDKVIIQEDYEKMIENKEIVVAKLQYEIIGYMIFNIKEIIKNIMRYRKQISVEAVCVEEKYRGKGVGTALLEYARKIGKENNCTDLYLTVNEENGDAIRLYKKFGLKVKNIVYSMEI